MHRAIHPARHTPRPCPGDPATRPSPSVGPRPRRALDRRAGGRAGRRAAPGRGPEPPPRRDRPAPPGRDASPAHRNPAPAAGRRRRRPPRRCGQLPGGPERRPGRRRRRRPRRRLRRAGPDADPDAADPHRDPDRPADRHAGHPDRADRAQPPTPLARPPRRPRRRRRSASRPDSPALYGWPAFVGGVPLHDPCPSERPDDDRPDRCRQLLGHGRRWLGQRRPLRLRSDLHPPHRDRRHRHRRRRPLPQRAAQQGGRRSPRLRHPGARRRRLRGAPLLHRPQLRGWRRRLPDRAASPVRQPGGRGARARPAGTSTPTTARPGASSSPSRWRSSDGLLDVEIAAGAGQAAVAAIEVIAPGQSAGQAMVDFALQHLGLPYIWATSGPTSFDCSGFTNWVAVNVLGVHIGLNQLEQIVYGTSIAPADLMPGDLVFFFNTHPTIEGVSHVGIYVGGGQVRPRLGRRRRGRRQRPDLRLLRRPLLRGGADRLATNRRPTRPIGQPAVRRPDQPAVPTAIFPANGTEAAAHWRERRPPRALTATCLLGCHRRMT